MIRIVAEALALPTATVTSYHRVLRQEGLVTKGGRGRSAATMSAEDVAKLLITLMASDSLDDAAAACHLLSTARFPGAYTEDERDLPDVDREPMELLEAVVILLTQLARRRSPSKDGTLRLPILDDVSSSEVILEVSASILEANIIAKGIDLCFQRVEPSPFTCPDDWMTLPPEERLMARASLDGLLIKRSVDKVVLRRVAEALP